jgi:hypothetical protein
VGNHNEFTESRRLIIEEEWPTTSHSQAVVDHKPFEQRRWFHEERRFGVTPMREGDHRKLPKSVSVWNHRLEKVAIDSRPETPA